MPFVARLRAVGEGNTTVVDLVEGTAKFGRGKVTGYHDTHISREQISISFDSTTGIVQVTSIGPNAASVQESGAASPRVLRKNVAEPVVDQDTIFLAGGKFPFLLEVAEDMDTSVPKAEADDDDLTEPEPEETKPAKPVSRVPSAAAKPTATARAPSVVHPVARAASKAGQKRKLEEDKEEEIVADLPPPPKKQAPALQPLAKRGSSVARRQSMLLQQERFYLGQFPLPLPDGAEAMVTPTTRVNLDFTLNRDKKSVTVIVRGSDPPTEVEVTSSLGPTMTVFGALYMMQTEGLGTVVLRADIVNTQVVAEVTATHRAFDEHSEAESNAQYPAQRLILAAIIGRKAQGGDIDEAAVEKAATTARPDSDEESVPNHQDGAGWDIYRLYESIRPRTRVEAPQPEDLLPKLRPYQRRALHWMVENENREHFDDKRTHPLFEQFTLPNGENIFFCPTTGRMSRVKFTVPSPVRGGILAEEMGLGKTVETLACILANPWPGTAPPGLGTGAERLIPVKTTLIVSPVAIVEQWRNEVMRHAPNSLKVLRYDGIASTKTAAQNDLTPQQLNEYDIILTTYDTLKKEVYYADTKPARALRHEKKFEIRKSPLMKVHWWRVCLDEAQMVETTTANAARMALMLHTSNRWCVTGTPIGKGGLNDIYGLVLFLQHNPFAERWWFDRHLLLPYISHTEGQARMSSFLQTVMWRHSKAHVENEVHLPPQTQEVMKLRLSDIEVSYYQRLYQQCLAEVGNLKRGDVLTGSNNVHSLVLRLRQTCCHPQIGAYGGAQLGRTFLPMEDILKHMIRDGQMEYGRVLRQQCSLQHELAFAEFLLDHLDVARTLYEKALATEKDEVQMLKDLMAKPAQPRDGEEEESEEHSPAHNLRLWQTLLLHATAKLSEVRAGLGDPQASALEASVETMKREMINTARDTEAQIQDSLKTLDARAAVEQARWDASPSSDKFDQKRVQAMKAWDRKDMKTAITHYTGAITAVAREDVVPDDLESLLLPGRATLKKTALEDTSASMERRAAALGGRLAAKDRLRVMAAYADRGAAHLRAAEVEFEAPNFEEDADYENYTHVARSSEQLGRRQHDDDEEKKRKEKEKAKKEEEEPKKRKLTKAQQLNLIESMKLEHERGVVMHNAAAALDCAAALAIAPSGGAAAFLSHYRNGIALARLQKWELATEEYKLAATASRSTREDVLFPEAQVKLDALTTKFDDIENPRQRLLLGLATPLCFKDSEVASWTSRHNIVQTEIGPLDQEIALRENTLRDLNTWLGGVKRAVRAEQASLNDSTDSFMTEAGIAIETVYQFVNEHIDRIHEWIKRQQQLIGPLRREQQEAARLWRARDDYIHKLTGLREAVAGNSLPVSKAADTVKRVQGELDALRPKVDAARSRITYLATLSDDASGNQDEDKRMCPICFDPIRRGLMTPCLHLFCEECLTAHVKRHNTCPTCRATITLPRCTPVATVKPTQNLKPRRQSSTVPTVSPLTLSRYPIEGSWGTKINTLIRYLLFLQETDPTIKSLVFSQWNDLLSLVQKALDKNSFKYVDLGGKAKQQAVDDFANDPSVKVFLLNAKSQGAGLTLVAATHVFLLEPILNPAIEMQAIARVHRLGQTKETTVHKFIMEDTVEERVMSLFQEKASKSAKKAAATRDENEVLTAADYMYLFGIETKEEKKGK